MMKSWSVGIGSDKEKKITKKAETPLDRHWTLQGLPSIDDFTSYKWLA